MKKLQYSSSFKIGRVLKTVYTLDPDNHDGAYEMLLLYVMHKSGLIEEGINKTQFDAAFDAFVESMEAMAELIDTGVAHDV